MNYQLLLDEVKQFVILYFQNHDDKRFIYHNLNHTQEVVSAATQISNHYQLNDEDFFIVTAAAWFHDTGYSGGTADHEVRGAEKAQEFLKSQQVDDAVIEKVKACIMATRLPQSPSNLLESILCDADLYHLGTNDFKRKSKLMRKEVELLSGNPADKQAWRQKTIELLESHRYQTDYCRLLLNDKKAENLKSLQEKSRQVEDENKDKDKTANKPQQPDEPAKLLPELPKEEQKGESKKKEKPEKGIETMFRITASNHQRLSDMADSKAHIMISVNSIVISLVVSLVLRRLDNHPKQIIPSMMLLTVCLIVVVFSILATRPNLPPGTFSQEDLDKRRINLLFFGNFYKMSLEQYTGGMHSMMNDRDFLYGSMIRDLYFQGVVLGRKYKLLRFAYSVFMYGLVASVLAFVISELL